MRKAHRAPSDGRIAGLTFRDAWVSTTAYVVSDAVTYGGETWTALAASTNVTPGSRVTKWSKLAAKGDSGPTGDAGPAGATGATGTAGATGPWAFGHHRGHRTTGDHRRHWGRARRAPLERLEPQGATGACRANRAYC